MSAHPEAESLARWPQQYGLVPAQPGTFLLSRCVEQDGSLNSFGQASVLAWAVSDLASMPVTLHGIDYYGRPVLMPDGQVEGVTCSWPSLEAFTKDMFEDERRCRGRTGS